MKGAALGIHEPPPTGVVSRASDGPEMLERERTAKKSKRAGSLRPFSVVISRPGMPQGQVADTIFIAVTFM